MANFGPLTAEIGWPVWGTPANFNWFRVLAALLHGIVVGVSQTLRRWTEGATYILSANCCYSLKGVRVLIINRFNTFRWYQTHRQSILIAKYKIRVKKTHKTYAKCISNGISIIIRLEARLQPNIGNTLAYGPFWRCLCVWYNSTERETDLGEIWRAL